MLETKKQKNMNFKPSCSSNNDRFIPNRSQMRVDLCRASILSADKRRIAYIEKEVNERSAGETGIPTIVQGRHRIQSRQLLLRLPRCWHLCNLNSVLEWEGIYLVFPSTIVKAWHSVVQLGISCMAQVRKGTHHTLDPLKSHLVWNGYCMSWSQFAY